MSMCRCARRLLVWGNGLIPDSICLITLDFWQLMQQLVIRRMSAFILFHIKRSLTNLAVTLAEGWDKLCVMAKTFSRKDLGINGLGRPVLTSHDKILLLIWKLTHFSELF